MFLHYGSNNMYMYVFIISAAFATFVHTQDLECDEADSHARGTVREIGRCGGSSSFTLLQVRTTSRQVYLVCFDTARYTTIFTEHFLEFDNRPPDNTDHCWNSQSGNFFPGISMNHTYNKVSEENTVNSLLEGQGGVPANVRYIDPAPDSSLYLARGHLVPNGDFKTLDDRGSTYHLVNAVPQWQIINNRNWGALEDYIRNRVNPSVNAITVYTGTHGIATLDAANGNPVEIWLGRIGDLIYYVIPIPSLMWKCFWDSTLNKFALIAMNNSPHFLHLSPELVTCPNACPNGNGADPSMPGISWNTRSLVNGYTHCCLFESCTEIKQVIKGFPGIDYS